jgi:hypothetical protein
VCGGARGCGARSCGHTQRRAHGARGHMRSGRSAAGELLQTTLDFRRVLRHPVTSSRPITWPRSTRLHRRAALRAHARAARAASASSRLHVRRRCDE